LEQARVAKIYTIHLMTNNTTCGKIRKRYYPRIRRLDPVVQRMDQLNQSTVVIARTIAMAGKEKV